MHKSHQPRIDVIAFELGESGFVKCSAVGAFKVTELNKSEWCLWISKHWVTSNAEWTN